MLPEETMRIFKERFNSIAYTMDQRTIGENSKLRDDLIRDIIAAVGEDTLIGKEFTYYDGELHIAQVAEYDPEVGLTAVLSNNPDFRILCINLMLTSSPARRERAAKRMAEIVEDIRNGFLSNKNIPSVSGGVPVDLCAFAG